MHGNHSTANLTDPLAVQAEISYTPEPSSFVLSGMGTAGLAIVLWKRRRMPRDARRRGLWP